MAHLILPRRTLWQPGGPVVPNWSSPVSRGLTFLYSGQAGGLVDLVGRNNVRTASAIATPIGLANYGVGTTSADYAHLRFTSNFTVWVWMYAKAVSTGTTDYTDLIGLPIYNSEGNNQGWVLQKGPVTHGSNGQPRIMLAVFNNNNVADYQAKSTTTFSAGDCNQWAGVFTPGAASGSRIVLYRDAVQDGNNGGGSTACATSSSQNLLMPGTAFSSSLYVAAAALWNRSLAVEELRQLRQNPWHLFQQHRRKFFIEVAAGAGQSLVGDAAIASGESFASDGVVAGPVTGSSPIATGESFPADGVVAGPITGDAAIASGESFPSAGSVTDEFQTLSGDATIASGESFSTGVVAGPITGDAAIASGESVPSSGTVSFVLVGDATIATAESFPTSGAVISYGVHGYDAIPSEEEFPRGGAVLRDDTRTLFIRGRDRTAYLAVNTLNVVEEFNGRASAQFELNNVGRSIYRPNPGEEVLFYRGTDRLFGGFVQSVVEQAFDSRSELKINVTCVDYRDLADRRTFAKTYEGPTFDLVTIVQEIFDATLAAEGVTYDAAETATVTGKRLVFDDETVATCLDRICSVFGFNWRIDHFRRLHLERATFETAPRVIRDEDGVWRNMRITRTNRQTRTRQGVRTAIPTGGQRTSTLAGNGTHDYLLSYSLIYPPKVVVNDVDAVVIAWEDRDTAPWDFAWERTSNLLRHNPAQAVYSSGDEIEVTQASSSLDVYWAEDSAAIASLAARTGGSGIVEAVTSAKNMRDAGMAAAFAETCFQNFGADISEIEFETDTAGWHIGQWLDVFTTSPMLCGVFIIQKVQLRDVGGTFLRYNITAQARELPLIVGLEITDTNEIVIEVDRPHGFESPYEGINLGGFDGEFGELINGGTYDLTPIDEYSFTVDLGEIDITGIDYIGGGGGSDGGGTTGYNGGPDPFGGYVWSGTGPEPGGTGIGGDDAFVITDVNTSTNVVTTSQPHGFTSSYPTESTPPFRVAIWGVTGAVGPTGSTINTPTTRVQVLSPTTFFAADVGVLFGVGSEPFQNDRRGRCAPTDAIVRTTLGSSEANAIRSFLAAGTYVGTNLDQERATFLLANAIPGVASRALATGVDVTNPWYAQKDLAVVESVSVVFGTPPEGAPVIVDIKQNGTSIFAAGTYLEVPAGSTDIHRVTTFRESPLAVERDDKFTVDVVGVGSDFPGCGGVVNLITRG